MNNEASPTYVTTYNSFTKIHILAAIAQSDLHENVNTM